MCGRSLATLLAGRMTVLEHPLAQSRVQGLAEFFAALRSWQQKSIGPNLTENFMCGHELVERPIPDEDRKFWQWIKSEQAAGWVRFSHLDFR